MKYFLWSNTEKKPIMRFFDHWFEVIDFFHLMDWEIGDTPFPVEVYEKIEDLEEKNESNGMRE